MGSISRTKRNKSPWISRFFPNPWLSAKKKRIEKTLPAHHGSKFPRMELRDGKLPRDGPAMDLRLLRPKWPGIGRNHGKKKPQVCLPWIFWGAPTTYLPPVRKNFGSIPSLGRCLVSSCRWRSRSSNLTNFFCCNYDQTDGKFSLVRDAEKNGLQSHLFNTVMCFL